MRLNQHQFRIFIVLTTIGLFGFCFLTCSKSSKADDKSGPLPVAATPEVSFEEGHRLALEKNPEGVNFQIRLPEGEQLSVSEKKVEIELSFSSSISERYEPDVSTYDRSGRIITDNFYVDSPKDVVDPRYKDFHPLKSSICGGLSAIPPILGADPYTFILDISDRIQFRKPGTYRFYMTANRIEEKIAPDAKDRTIKMLPVTSNILTVEVAP